MKQYENVLVTMSETCAEIEKATAKALRFGLKNHHPDAEMTNAEEIMAKVTELNALVESLQQYGQLPVLSEDESYCIKKERMTKLAKWQEVSFDCGTLQGNK